METLVENIGLVTVCLVLVLALAAWATVLLLQRRVAASAGGLPVALKRGSERWSNGVARYEGDELVWYRAMSLSPIAAMRLPRSELSVLATRPWDPARDMALRPNLTIVECRLPGNDVSLGFPDNGVTGFLSWLEASAPRF